MIEFYVAVRVDRFTVKLAFDVLVVLMCMYIEKSKNVFKNLTDVYALTFALISWGKINRPLNVLRQFLERVA